MNKDNEVLTIYEDFVQILLLDSKGQIVESCDTLFDTTQLPNQSAIELSPLVESIFDYLLDLTSDEPEVSFSKVEASFPQLNGFYDFSFAPVSIDDKKYIIWRIYDHTSLYTELQINQQRMHDLELQRHRLYNKFQSIVEKNLSIKQKAIPSKRKSLLIEANNIILRQVFADLEQLTEATKTSINNTWIESFFLKKVLARLELGLDKNKNSLLDITISSDEDYQIIGSQSRLIYILYDLLSLSNQGTNEKIKLHLKTQLSTDSSKLELSISIFNPNFIEEQLENINTKSEISPTKINSIHLQISLVQKLIELQSGQFKILKNVSQGTDFEVQLTYPILQK